MTPPRRPLILHLPGNAPPVPLGHRFPRSHEPPERKVETSWLRLRCPCKPEPEQRLKPALTEKTERTRKPQES
jgi:hypothetical protein